METRNALPGLVRRAGMPFGEQLGALQRQMDRLFSEFAGRWSAVSPSSGNCKYWPALDMIQTNDAVDITAELPGINPKEVDTTKVEARFDKGLLKVHIGKPASAKKDVKKIPIGAA
jgi:HSP20 family molecular chaperone IbpA